MNNPLDQLRDIHLPDALQWWPPAPGWWLLALFNILAFVYLGRYLRARYHRLYFRGETKNLLKESWQYFQENSANNNADKVFIESTLSLLRRAAKTAGINPNLPAEHLASLPTPALLEALNEYSNGKLTQGLALHKLSERLYRPDSSALSKTELQYLYNAAKSWLKSDEFKNPAAPKLTLKALSDKAKGANLATLFKRPTNKANKHKNQPKKGVKPC